jgi:hypothetical protein
MLLVAGVHVLEVDERIFCHLVRVGKERDHVDLIAELGGKLSALVGEIQVSFTFFGRPAFGQVLPCTFE